MYVVSHHVIFLTSYVLVDNITTGWLVLNVWHNLQYIMFVWWANNRRFGDQVNPEHKLISTLSQRKHVIAYLVVCMGIATVFYTGVQSVSGVFKFSDAVSIALIATMVLNFHHYVVDGIIWKRRNPAAPKVEAA
ncbi:MAG: hypothetical protein R3B90_18710 [Planctomycetaceae bacterium]